MPDGNKLSEFAAWCEKNITGDEKGQAQIFLDRLFQAFWQRGNPSAPDYAPQALWLGAIVLFSVNAAQAASG